jgi:predicted secreted Zn-dependent protease
LRIPLLLLAVFGLFSIESATPKQLPQFACPLESRYKFYEISGTSMAELRADMLRKGPTDEHGTPSFAYTAWGIKWDWPKLADGTPNFLNTQLSCTATITVPRLRPNSETPLSVIREWHVLYEKILRHEHNHVLNAVGMAATIRERVRAAALAGKIRSEREATREGHAVLDIIREFDRRYDERTHFGKSEGVWVPR